MQSASAYSDSFRVGNSRIEAREGQPPALMLFAENLLLHPDM